ncbi:hypothetical protein [Pseudomonas neuropathica]|uniref:Uncharacterized protein n=1 Tax=Pseudomonas neuropathica TaxID=2730425 RepID=A0ACC7MRL1_9PSED
MPTPQQTLIIGFMAALLLVIPFVLSLRRSWIKQGFERATEHTAMTMSNCLAKASEELAAANRQLFAQRLDSAIKIEQLQKELSEHNGSITLALRMDTADLKTLNRMAGVLTLAAETFDALRASGKATEARSAALECVNLASRLQSQNGQSNGRVVQEQAA